MTVAIQESKIDSVKCPYCSGSVQNGPDVFDGERGKIVLQCDCEGCGKYFVAWKEVIRVFETRKIEGE
jgi:hypothetical protein